MCCAGKWAKIACKSRHVAFIPVIQLPWIIAGFDINSTSYIRCSIISNFRNLLNGESKNIKSLLICISMHHSSCKTFNHWNNCKKRSKFIYSSLFAVMQLARVQHTYNILQDKIYVHRLGRSQFGNINLLAFFITLSVKNCKNKL